jgi:CubicO group peptidase (beta-lactamase class C family)
MLALLALLSAAAQQPLPPDSTVRAIVAERVATLHGAGIVVGLFGPDDERRVVAVGVPGDRVFEIGAITDVFTGAILADMAANGAAQLDDSILGMDRLGDTLALRTGRKYEDLVRKHVLWPLGMKETAIALVPDLRSRLALGHDAEGRVIPNRDFVAGSGTLRSTVKDMLTFLMVNIDSATTPTGRALHQRLAWRIRASPGGSIVWYNDGSGGYRSYIGFDPARGVGVVVLSNASVDVDDIGFHLLDETFPLQPPRRKVQ